jgi:hypothetical protein
VSVLFALSSSNLITSSCISSTTSAITFKLASDPASNEKLVFHCVLSLSLHGQVPAHLTIVKTLVAFSVTFTISLLIISPAIFFCSSVKK